jgi:alkylhydroperoxidase/carboxymuconolactone decarboxylase family protein YurZ
MDKSQHLQEFYRKENNVRDTIKYGVKQEELIEKITHLAFYAGWPNAMAAVRRAKELLGLEKAHDA